MKKRIWLDILSEKTCKKLLCVLVPILVIGMGYITICDDHREEQNNPPFRIYTGIFHRHLEVFRDISPAVVLIETFNENNGPRGSGTGFFISSKGHVITNYHVIRGAYSVKIRTIDGKVYPVKGLTAKDPRVDLAELIVASKDANFPFLELSSILPSWGEKTIVLGHPGGGELTLSSGVVQANGRISTKCQIFQISAPVFPGSSGSPVLNSEGQVIGVVKSCKVPDSDKRTWLNGIYKRTSSFATNAIAGSKIYKLKSTEGVIELSKSADSPATLPLSRLFPEI